MQHKDSCALTCRSTKRAKAVVLGSLRAAYFGSGYLLRYSPATPTYGSMRHYLLSLLTLGMTTMHGACYMISRRGSETILDQFLPPFVDSLSFADL